MTTPFFQEPPSLKNPYEKDPLLRSILERALPPDLRVAEDRDLRRLAARVLREVGPLGRAAELSPPRHVPFEPWGARIDRVEVSPAWTRLREIACEEGLVATGYDAALGEHARLLQHARAYLFSPACAVYTCPMAMTDGAARLTRTYGDPHLQETVLPRLVTRDPSRFWTSGQWMTERAGGSDLSGSEARAEPQRDGTYRLYGIKWFTSAVLSEVAFTLGRLPDSPPGSRGLSLFFVRARGEEGALQHITLLRLKDKLGTRALPTAEIELLGAPARLVGGEGQGVKKITTLMNVTRLWNATCAAGSLRRGLQTAIDYARRREAFGRRLLDLPLHRETLARLATEQAVSLLLTARTASLLGRVDIGVATDREQALFRILTPLIKLFTAKQAIGGLYEVLEAIGGAGVLEDTGLPQLYRDALVLSIWEGTTNVLSLDVLRAIAKEGALEPWAKDARELAGAGPLGARILEAVHLLEPQARAAALEPNPERLAGARDLAYGLARTYAAALLVDHAGWAESKAHPKAASFAALARGWLETPLVPTRGAAPGEAALVLEAAGA